MTALAIPTVHSNGTSRTDLVEQNLNVLAAVTAAIVAIGSAGPNGRDYYPQGPDVILVASRQHRERIAKLQSVYDDIETITEAVSSQRTRRAA